MKTHQRFTLLLLSGILFVTSCATEITGPQVNTWRKHPFAPTTTNTFALTERPNASLEDVQLNRLLLDEAQRAGYTFTTADQADYLLAYLTDSSGKTVVNGAISAQNLATLMNTPATNNLNPSTNTDPHGFIFNSREITLYLYTNPRIHPGGLDLIWQGAITAGQMVTEDRETILLRTLIRYLGKDHYGLVDLAQ